LNRQVFSDPGFWFLVLINSWLIYYYLQTPGEFNTIVWIYWLQSVLIGLFTFIQLLRIKNPDEKSLTMNNQPISKNSMGCAAFFFLAHYGLFHFVYAIFLLVGFSKGANTKMILITGCIFLIESTMQLLRKRNNTFEQKENVGKIFLTPYLRIVPMHLMILLPNILDMSVTVVFLILKTMADIAMYMVTTRMHNSSQPV
jgi:hypothetical protein